MVHAAVYLPEEGTEQALDGSQKYSYPEFAGWRGERYLKKLLRQILPAALYRTWDIFADHQGQGQDCYLSLTHLAEIAGRHMRTMEKNLASLCAKQLLVERAKRKVFRGADGQVVSRVVIIKDFGGLYALAHDYHTWLSDPNYIMPDRETIALLAEFPQLVARVRRFENYRHLLAHRQPGPEAKQREEDRWFTSYQQHVCSPSQEEQAEGASVLQNNMRLSWVSGNDLPTDSSIRRDDSPLREDEGSDAVDLVDLSFSNAVEELEQVHLEGDHEEPSDAEQRAHGAFALKSMSEVSIRNDPTMPLSASELAASFLCTIGGPFGDQSPKGSQTRLCALVSEVFRSEPGKVLSCLVRAYVVARDTRTIRAKHLSPTGVANRMPLFFAMLQRFLEETALPGEELWHVVEDALASDPHLTRWWNEHQRQISLPSRALSDVGAAEAFQEAEEQEPETAETVRRAPRPTRVSQSDAAREARAKLARQVLQRLGRMGVVLRDATVFWEHIICGCPLYYRPKGQDVCALCMPDPTWPAEALALL
ncbi:MAG TPA: hypothetical protein VFN35_13600, partial [Ktedonobacteraceae bacterium]|nr:hypothetical protein [Ktedonobacteraceae bacterium]